MFTKEKCYTDLKAKYTQFCQPCEGAFETTADCTSPSDVESLYTLPRKQAGARRSNIASKLGHLQTSRLKNAGCASDLDLKLSSSFWMESVGNWMQTWLWKIRWMPCSVTVTGEGLLRMPCHPVCQLRVLRCPAVVGSVNLCCDRLCLSLSAWSRFFLAIQRPGVLQHALVKLVVALRS